MGIIFVIVAGLLIWLSVLYFTEKFTTEERARAEGQLTLYSGRLIAELQRVSVVPLLLAKDKVLIDALNSGDHAQSSQRLINFQEDIGSKSIFLLDDAGRVVAATDRRLIGSAQRDAPFFTQALRSQDRVFSQIGAGEGSLGFYYARKIEANNETIGVIVVEMELDAMFVTWTNAAATILVMDSEGTVLLSNERQFRNLSLDQVVEAVPIQNAVQRAIRSTGEWSNSVADAFLLGQPLYQTSTIIPFQGWRMVLLDTFQDVRTRVNSVIALEVTVLAILAALGFYILSRRAIRQSFAFKAESEELRALNDRLSAEISQREQAELELRIAEQSLAQSSKLAALGEMSAAVSHELNQPLAAMRTYLAGASLLLKRKRPDEAISSFNRIDDLIERMGAITKQLKSYARKGGDELAPLDMRDAVNSSVSMMSPQLGQSHVKIVRDIPDFPVMVMGDPVRIEQVIVNLLRNALDAMKGQTDAEIEIKLSADEMASLTVLDNGTGIENLENLFEPFYTTKLPGDGVGLGLAISSGIAKDMGGRLFARNVIPNGAAFEFQLPRLKDKEIQAAE